MKDPFNDARPAGSTVCGCLALIFALILIIAAGLALIAHFGGF